MRLMKTADQPVQRPPAALTRSSRRAEWIGTAQDGTSQQAPRTDVDASAELSDRETSEPPPDEQDGDSWDTAQMNTTHSVCHDVYLQVVQSN